MIEQEIFKILKPGLNQSDYRNRQAWTQTLHQQLSQLGYSAAHPLNSDFKISTDDWFAGVRALANENPLLALFFLNESTVNLLINIFYLPECSIQNTAMSLFFAEHQNSQINFIHNDEQIFLFCCEWKGPAPTFNLFTFAKPPLRIRGVDFASILNSDDQSLFKCLHAKNSEVLGVARKVICYYINGVNTILVQSLNEALRLSTQFSFERIQGGRPIIEWPEHKDQLVNLSAKKSLLENLCRSTQASETQDKNPSCCLLLAELIETVPNFVSQCMQLFGGTGYMMDSKVESLFRATYFLSSLYGTPTAIRNNLITSNDLKEIYA